MSAEVDAARAKSKEARRLRDRLSIAAAIAFGSGLLSFVGAEYFPAQARAFFRPPGRSDRAPEAIVGEVRAFFSVRPRPWRPANFAPKVRRSRRAFHGKEGAA